MKANNKTTPVPLKIHGKASNIPETSDSNIALSAFINFNKRLLLKIDYFGGVSF